MSALSCGCDPAINHTCEECAKTQLRDDSYKQPFIYPCGCSKLKVNAGLCEHYKPGELP